MFASHLKFSICVWRRPFSISHANPSGHNKWSKIKQKKGVMDAQKGVIYGKASRDILVAVRNGGSADPEKNLTLAAVLKRAKLQGVPKENIESALTKATKGKEKGGDQNLTYEALAYNSVGMIIECLTENANRTIHNIRDILNAHNARLAPVGFMFERKGYVRVAVNKGEGFDDRMESLIDGALDAMAEDFGQSNSTEDLVEVEFTCRPSALASLTATVMAHGVSRELLASELIYSPIDPTGSSVDDDLEAKMSHLIEELEENEDTLRVWTSLDT